MLFPYDKMWTAFDNVRIMSRSSPGTTTVLIVAAMNCDSVCATRIITDLLQRHDVLYELRGIDNFQEMDDLFNMTVLAPSSTFRSIILINCGGLIDLMQRYMSLFDHKGANGLYMYVLDSARPLHHRNVASQNKNIIVLGGEFIADREELPSYSDDEDTLLHGEDSDSEEEDGEDDDDDETELKHGAENEDENEKHIVVLETSPMRGGGTRREFHSPSGSLRSSTKRHLSPVTTPVSGKITTTPMRKRHSPDTRNEGTMEIADRPSSPPPSGIDAIKLRRRRMMAYYNGTYQGYPASHTAYELSHQVLRNINNQILWWAIVGTVHRYCCDEIERSKYEDMVQWLRRSMLDLNIPGAMSMTTTYNKEGTRIDFVENELRLMHYRHWCLFQSIFHTEHIASGFGAWQADGEARLDELFARLGINRRLAHQEYRYLARDVKENLATDLVNLGADYALGEVTFPSFVRRDGYEMLYSASDYGFVIAAMLDCCVTNDSKMINIPHTRFMNAYSTLGCTSESRNQLEAGLHLSQMLHNAVVHKGVAIRASKLIVSSGDFRYALIHAEQFEGVALAHVFTQPQGLLRLALFLRRAHQADNKWLHLAAKPFLLVMHCNDKALIAGLPCPKQLGEVSRNAFGRFFREAAKAIDCHVKHDFFESCVVEIDSDQVQRFLYALGDLMNSVGL